MSSRLRSLDSKITFFAFADIITAVSGVLIFVALLLATDLGTPTESRSRTTNPEIGQQLQETLALEADLDARNQRVQELLATAETAPDPNKLQADIKRLRSQLDEERKKEGALASQMAESQDAIAKRDAVLGLTDLKAKIQSEMEEVRSIASQDAKVRAEMAVLDQHIAGVQSKLLQIRQREGKLWLIPDKGSTTKEPILATVSASGVKVERFDRPDQTKDFSKSSARSEFDAYLNGIKPLDQYVVFLMRPSGIGLFQDLVKSARDKGIEVGYDALEEDKQIYFSTPPVIDETVPVQPAARSTGDGGYSDPGGGAGGVARTSGGQGDGNRTSGGSNFGSDNGSGAQPGYGSGTGSNQAGTASAFQAGSGRSPAGSPPGGGSGIGAGNGKGASSNATNGNGTGRGFGNSAAPGTETSKAVPTSSSKPAPPPAPVTKSWWQRFLEWIGYR